MCRIFAWILRLGVPSRSLLASKVKHAKLLLLNYAQKDISHELQQCLVTGKGRFKRLAPFFDTEDGLFIAGSHLRHHAPFTLDHKLPLLLPKDHPIMLRIMEQSH